jgi:hypothetical protein
LEGIRDKRYWPGGHVNGGVEENRLHLLIQAPYMSLVSTPLLTKRSLASTVNRFLTCSVTVSSARSTVSVSVSARCALESR